MRNRLVAVALSCIISYFGDGQALPAAPWTDINVLKIRDLIMFEHVSISHVPVYEDSKFSIREHSQKLRNKLMINHDLRFLCLL